MTTEFQYDVFLSHNQADMPRVRRLAERLRAAGPFKFGTRNSELGIARLCLSPTALGSDWVGLERSTVLFRDPANAGRRFIPLLLAKCNCPKGASTSSPRLAPRAYLGFTMPDRNNPDGVVASAICSLTQPCWGCGFFLRRYPRVARASQPWALRHSLVGADQARREEDGGALPSCRYGGKGKVQPYA